MPIAFPLLLATSLLALSLLAILPLAASLHTAFLISSAFTGVFLALPPCILSTLHFVTCFFNSPPISPSIYAAVASALPRTMVSGALGA